MEQFTYLIKGANRKYKIGRSKNPEKRLKGLKTANPDCRLICYGTGRTEKQMHDIFAKFKFKREWYILQPFQVEMAIKLIKGTEGQKEIEKSGTYRAKAARTKHQLNYTISFGKYKGKRVYDIDDIQYLMWLLKQPDFDRTCPVLSKVIKMRLKTYSLISGI